jgi:hypothetical protein
MLYLRMSLLIVGESKQQPLIEAHRSIGPNGLAWGKDRRSSEIVESMDSATLARWRCNRLGPRRQRKMLPGDGTISAPIEPASVGARKNDARIDEAESQGSDIEARHSLVGFTPGFTGIGCLVNPFASACVQDTGT